ncbi:hypothetical protein ACWENO_19975 [Streptomyces sp. NPDC004436]
MTKNGSNARKQRIRAHAAETGLSYRAAASAVDRADFLAVPDDVRAAIKWMRAFNLRPEALAEERECYLYHLSEEGAGLPAYAQACLYALLDRLGTGDGSDPCEVKCTIDELAAATGLRDCTVEESLHVAQAHGWIIVIEEGEYELVVPSRHIEMCEYFLNEVDEPVEDEAAYERLRERLAAEPR